MMEKLAIHGGPKSIQNEFKKYNSIGKEEEKAAQSVIESGVLSKFLGSWDPDFYGGPYVQKFEREAEKYFGVKHAITVNSWTSGLIAAVGALGVEPGDEIIVSPWTMSASATAILHWNAIPVFADIESETFCLDPVSVEKNITEYTKAIMVVDIFGQSANMEALAKIAKKYNLRIINDTAQAPGSIYKGKYTGTLGDIGGYSLNYHKHIHTGEGGIIVTDDDELAEKMRLIRNHAEAVVAGKGTTDLVNLVGYNFRLGEIEAAIGIEQLKKLKEKVLSRQEIAKKLTKGLAGLKSLQLPNSPEDSSHVFYIFGMIFNADNQFKTSRAKVIEALNAEGVSDLMGGYTNIHQLPIYQKKIAYGSSGFPWKGAAHRDVSYTKGICPIAEDLHERTFIGFEMCVNELTDSDVNGIIRAFQKVWHQIDTL